MNRIRAIFERHAADRRPLLIPYITPEFPVKGSTVPMMKALAEAGAAMIELGIPFSDPLADGPTIQHSSDVAIRNGVTLPVLFGLLAEARASVNVPVLLMGYVNPVIRYGVERFVADAQRAGADGFIIPDLPPEESGALRDACLTRGMSLVHLIAPTSSDERIRRIDEATTDFSYCVSVTGVTGDRSAGGPELGRFLGRVRANTSKPFVVGFGISTRDHVAAVLTHADGAVVGSALLKAVSPAASPDEAARLAASFLTSLR